MPMAATVVHQVRRIIVYKASRARAAAPRTPAAWVTWAAAPEDCEAMVGVAEPVIVMEAVMDMSLIMDMELIMDAELSDITELSDAELSDAELADADIMELSIDMELISDEMELTIELMIAEELSGDTLDMEAEGAMVMLMAPDWAGTETETPAAAQVCWTAWMVAIWSSAEQDFCTQGIAEAKRVSAFLQWQPKSVREEQPSEVRGATKHCSYSVLALLVPMCSQSIRTAQEGMLSS
jgi:hypothetical protein